MTPSAAVRDRRRLRVLLAVSVVLPVVMFGPSLVGVPYPEPVGRYLQFAGIVFLFAVYGYRQSLRTRIKREQWRDERRDYRRTMH